MAEVKVVWFCFLLVWMGIAIYEQNLWTVLWWLLFFMWVLLLLHYSIAYRRWKKEMDIRIRERRERLEKILEGSRGGTETAD